MIYSEFLERKLVKVPVAGFSVNEGMLNAHLFPFQAAIVRWALALGRAAVFADCGLGKTLMQLEWAWQVHLRTGGDVLILAPLAVTAQTAREGLRFGIPVTVCRSQADVRPGINVTNYDRLAHFDTRHFAGVVLDESSILKCFMGKTKQALLKAFANTTYRLACTATPAPNDHLELGNHADFLGVMPANEMLMRWFINDTMHAGGYRLKRHAEKDYWRWVTSWAVSMSRPSDLGFSDDGFILPPLNIHRHIVDVDHSQATDGSLFRMADLSATSLHREMRLTSAERARQVAEIVAANPLSWMIWCNTNYEADALREALPAAMDVRGSETAEEKERKLLAFTAGEERMLISKPSLAGFGMNFQHCHNMAFVGLSYSYEQLYQALRRSWRYGQTEAVDAHIVCAESEIGVLETIQRKQKEHEAMKEAMYEACRENMDLAPQAGRSLRADVEEDVATGDGWRLHLGDSCQTMKRMEADSVGFSVFSPPFANLYIYSDSLADMGNSVDSEEFFVHFGFVIDELLRVTIPGRLCAVHCKDLPLYKGRDGAAGLVDFPGAIVRAFEARGWTYHSRVTIWKDPVIEMQRTKNHGLLYKQLCKDSSASRQGMADYLVVFRKWADVEDLGSFPDPVTTGGERFDRYIGQEPPEYADDHRHYSIQVWQRYASPVWFDVQQTRVLNADVAREAEDEKHICPLQLGVIERSIELWTNPGDLVFSPFAGIGSEGVTAIKMGRRFEGIELKRTYWEWAIRYLKAAQIEAGQQDMFTEQHSLALGVS